MGTMLACVLLIAAILPLSALLVPPEGRGSTSYRGALVVVLALGVLFFALGAVHPVDAPGAWAFRAFYGSLSLLTAVAANLLTCFAETSVQGSSDPSKADDHPTRDDAKIHLMIAGRYSARSHCRS